MGLEREERTELTMSLQRGVKSHDGQPFTTKNGARTWNLSTGRGNDKLRINPRKGGGNPEERYMKGVSGISAYETEKSG